MSEEKPRSVRFCPACGDAAVEGARFCTACGAELGGRGSLTTTTASSSRLGFVILGAFLAVGLGLWFAILAPEGGLRRLPLAEREPAGSSAGPAEQGEAAELPADHPAIDLPPEVVRFIDNLESQTRDDPENAEIWRNLAQVQYRAGQVDPRYLERAKASFEKVLELEPGDLEAHRGLGNVAFDNEEHARAVTHYQKYLETRPDDPNVRTDLGTMYLYTGKPEEAVEEYRKVISDHPDFYQANFNLGIALRQRGESEAALEEFRTALAKAPDDATRQQIQQVIDQVGGGAPAGGAPVAPTGFQARIEEGLRGHEIVGPKVVRFEWSEPTRGRVVLDRFPMDAMPEMIRERFLERVRGQLADALRETGAGESAQLDLVDLASGEVMASVEAGTES